MTDEDAEARRALIAALDRIDARERARGNDAAQFFFDVGKDMAERQAEQIERMARTIARYRGAIRYLVGDGTALGVRNGKGHIAEIERELTDDDRERIGDM